MSVDINNLTFFKRQSHLLMDEPQTVVLKQGLSFNTAFSRKIIKSGYKRCKLALDVKDDDYSKANNLYIILTNEEIENGGNILPLTHPQRNMGTIRYFVACKELIDRVPRFDAMRNSSSRSERRLFVKQLQENIFQVTIEANFENEVQDMDELIEYFNEVDKIYEIEDPNKMEEFLNQSNILDSDSQTDSDDLKEHFRFRRPRFRRPRFRRISRGFRRGFRRVSRGIRRIRVPKPNFNALKRNATNFANKVKSNARNYANKLKNGARNAANAIKRGAQNAARKIKNDAINAANKITGSAADLITAYTANLAGTILGLGNEVVIVTGAPPPAASLNTINIFTIWLHANSNHLCTKFPKHLRRCAIGGAVCTINNNFDTIKPHT